jgi:hypothetical protein
MSHAAVGFRAHSGWAALVSIFLVKSEPVVFCRHKLQLVEELKPQFCQPYHAAARMPFEKAEKFILEVKAQAQRLACKGLRRLGAELMEKGHSLTACGLLTGSGRKLPELERILAAHPLIHTAEGILFREALADAAKECGLFVLEVREKQLLTEGAKALGMAEQKLLARVTELGRPLGSPWSQDEKYATVAAWLALRAKAGRTKPQT